MFYSTICDQETETNGECEVADQGLVRETACAVVGKLKSGEVTPLDLLDVLEKRIAEVDGKVNALPTLCFDRARKHATALMKKPASERGILDDRVAETRDLHPHRVCLERAHGSVGRRAERSSRSARNGPSESRL